MKVLSFSYCFPNAAQPAWGVFVRQRLAALGRLAELEVVAPVPAFPLLGRLRGRPPAAFERQDGLAVHRPRFLCVPGLLKSQDARFYACGLAGWLDDYCTRQGRPDLLDAHFVWPDGVGVARLARRLRTPFAITLRGKIYPCLEVRSMRRQCADALRGAAAVISVDRPMADLAVGLGVDPARVHVIANGVDLERFRPADRAEARVRLGLPADGPLLVAVAHLKPTKGVGDLVEAVGRLPAQVRCVIVGGEAQRGYRRVLEARIESLGLTGRVVLAGPQPYDRVPLYLAAADAAVLPSHREGCPNVVLEGLACGTPVVATRVGAVPELIEDGVNGRIVPPRDPAALADALGDVLARSWSPAAVRASRCVKSWDEVAEKVKAVFDGVLGRPGPGPADLTGT